jgi:hypothetical protein
MKSQTVTSSFTSLSGEQRASDNEGLLREAATLHQTIFGRPITKDLEDAFVLANQALMPTAHVDHEVDVDLLIRKSLDIEAIEIALRRKRPHNSLSKKMQIMCYLAECRSVYFSDFVNEEKQPVKAFLLMAFHTFRSIYKLAKGTCLIRLYDVV